MGSEVAKAELEVLAQEKLDDAAALIADSRWSSGYYIAGHAVELALKACIAKVFKADTIPDRDLVNATYSQLGRRELLVAQCEVCTSHSTAS